jgi:PKD repeat protein
MHKLYYKKNLKNFLTFTHILLLFLLVVTTARAQNPLKVTVTTDKDSYQLRELVNIYGNVTYNDNQVTEGLVALQVEDPLKTIVARTVPANSVPMEDWKVEIISLISCDDEGNLKLSFKKGGWANFKVTIRNKLPIPQEVRVVVNVYDSIMIPLDLISVQWTIAPETTDSYMPSIWIDEWASTGNATAYANVYTDWPKDGGYPYCPEKATTFNIVSFEGESPTESPEIQIPQVEASYQTIFRLSPGPPPGIYRISVNALYKGYKALETKIFQVESLPTPPRASFAYWPPQAGPGIEVTFDGSSSTAEGYNDTITSYAWDFGDNQTGTGPIVRHTYSTEGNYTVTLNVTDLEGFWNATSKIIQVTTLRDITILNIECLNEIYSDWLVTIKVIVKNNGTVPETFTVSTYYNNSILNIVTITDLEPFSQKTVIITWNTTGLSPYTNYTLRSEASVVQNEINTTNNVFIFGTIWVKMLGDVNGDKQINIYDIVLLTSVYGTKVSDPLWNPQTDLYPDGKIDIYDVVIATSKYDYKYAS